jgi:D-aminopeptidase
MNIYIFVDMEGISGIYEKDQCSPIPAPHGLVLTMADIKACAEAASILPWAELAEVKKELTCQGDILAPPGRAHALIREKAKAGVEYISSAKPYTVDKPVKLKVEHIERMEIPGQYSKPFLRRKRRCSGGKCE